MQKHPLRTNCMYKVMLQISVEKNDSREKKCSVFVNFLHPFISRFSFSDFSNLPYLIDRNFKTTQSKATLYYLGQGFDLMGTNSKEEARHCEKGYDVHIQYALVCYKFDRDSKVERKRFVETTISDYLKKFDNYLEQNLL